MKGFFITLEGGEAAGKSTLLLKLYEYLILHEKRKVVQTREPGGTEVGKKIRDIILSPKAQGPAPLSEFFLYLADRAHHVETVIKPALERGYIVLCDRFTDSTFAYQGAARKIFDGKRFNETCHLAASDLIPDLTLYLDIEPRIAFQRFRREKDRLELEKLDFHERVRDAYLDLVRKHPSRIIMIDASLSPEDVYQLAIRYVQEKLSTLV